MSYLKDIILEEYSRLQDLSKKYKDAIASFPKGSISIKKRGKKEYLYLAKREGKKVRFDYIGHADDMPALDLMEKIGLRKDFEKKLKQMSEDLKEIGKFVDGRKI